MALNDPSTWGGKYFKPLSMSWWASASPLLAGVIVGSEPMHGLAGLVQTVNEFTGGMSALALVNLGLAGIGFRGAMK